jgi:hypothetical protein
VWGAQCVTFYFPPKPPVSQTVSTTVALMNIAIDPDAAKMLSQPRSAVASSGRANPETILIMKSPLAFAPHHLLLISQL